MCSLKNNLNFGSVHTAENYTKYLEEAYLFLLLSRFSYKLKEQVKSPKKIYSIDTGAANAVGFKFTGDTGRLMENLVALELVRRGLEIYYWKDYAGREVDFIIKRLEIEQLIQVCYNVEDPDTKGREVKALVNASEELKCKNMLVITWDYEGTVEIKKRKIKFIPLWKWLLR